MTTEYYEIEEGVFYQEVSFSKEDVANELRDNGYECD